MTASAAKTHKTTPMMEQFLGIKEEAGEEVLLFYRMGDFYELFFNDAVRAAAALDIALTKRGKHQGEDIPMCGVPVHSAESYLQKLIRLGFRVAVCEQTEDPAEAKKRGSKAVVRREIVRLVTPGTLTEDSLLEARGANYIAALARTKTGDCALAWADISDGSFRVQDIPTNNIGNALSAITPRELVIAESSLDFPDLYNAAQNSGASLTPVADVKFSPRSGETRLTSHYNVSSLESFGQLGRAEISAAGALLDYLELTQAGVPAKLSAPKRESAGKYLSIDPATRASLEITQAQSGGRKGSLLSDIDKTVTGPGARELQARLARPLTDIGEITHRLDAVSYFENRAARDYIREALAKSGDAARALSRLILGRGGPRDLATIFGAMKTGEQLNAEWQKQSWISPPRNIERALSALSLAKNAELSSLVNDLTRALRPDLPMQARDGGFIAKGWSAELDSTRALRDDSRRIIAGLQSDYAKAADVPGLKIKHNNVLGYFIEVTPRHADKLMGDEARFIHRQTLVSGVRFTTTELAELGGKIAAAGERAQAIELNIFAGFVERLNAVEDDIRDAASALAALDVYSALALWSEDNGAVRPTLDDSRVFNIKGGRHPVVEQALKKDGSSGFTPNDCALDGTGASGDRLTLITGPNMAGKSTFLRQNALMIVLAQAGSFVPAGSAHIGRAKALYSRVGASDDLARGRSTFMVEMIETAAILNQAGPDDFVILDEIGRGTATFDGLSIAWAAAEHLHEVNQCRTLFATHYHELTDLAASLEFGGNASLRAKEWDGDLIFLHDVKSGPADKSYGIQVAKLAGLPPAAVTRAKDVLARLEDQQQEERSGLGELPLFSANPSRTEQTVKPSEIETALAALDVDDLSPREALDLLYAFRDKAKGEL